MIVLLARYEVKPGQGDKVEEILIDLADMVETYEQDCLMFQVSRSVDNPDQFLLYEQYFDEAAVEAHRETPYFKSHILEKVIPLLKTREIAFYEPVAG